MIGGGTDEISTGSGKAVVGGCGWADGSFLTGESGEDWRGPGEFDTAMELDVFDEQRARHVFNSITHLTTKDEMRALGLKE